MKNNTEKKSSDTWLFFELWQAEKQWMEEMEYRAIGRFTQNGYVYDDKGNITSRDLNKLK